MAPRLGIIGYGRFGRAFAGLALDAGIPVRAYDASTQAPDELRADSLEALVGGVDLVALAVPVPALAEVVDRVARLAGPEHVVFDVSSVKLVPEALMAERFGGGIPWVATHPLFGPSALALGERPLRAVVCPNRRHPAAVAAVRDLFARLGCEVIEQDADTHDRRLARGHALTFFVAKGMLEVGREALADDGPPSVRAMAQVVDSVRSDAGHLFRAIERDNPYAADARTALIEALERVHVRLGEEETDPERDAAALQIPALGDQAPELRELRSLIDELDLELVRLLARRTRLARGAGRIKASRDLEVRDPVRERELLARRREWARELGLDEEAVAAVFRSIVRLSRGAQREDPSGAGREAPS